MNRFSLDCQLADSQLPPGLGLDGLEEFGQAVLAHQGKDAWDVSIVLCDDPFIAELNKGYRQKDGPTDVLSFEQGEWYVDEDGQERWLAGDIVIALPTVARNAADFVVEYADELRRVLAHGLLHLAGHDHRSNDADEPMLRLQESILAELAGTDKSRGGGRTT